jgi:cytochrome c oxidase subunit 2
MIGRVIVLEPRQYQDWLGGSQATASLSGAGEQLFLQLGCSGCHAAEAGERAPSLVGIFGQPVELENGESVIADENYIRESILFPMRKVVAGFEPIMPTYEGRITEEQLVQLVTYIKLLGDQPGTETTPAGASTESPERTEP